MMMNNAIRRVEINMYKRIKSKPPYYRRSMQDSNLHADDDKLNLNGGWYYGKYYGAVRGVK